RELHGPFVFEDFGLPFYRPGFPTEAFTVWIGSVRPLLMLSYWTNFQISGRLTYSYHLLNLLLYIANPGAVFQIVRRLLQLTPINQSWLDILPVFGAPFFYFILFKPSPSPMSPDARKSSARSSSCALLLSFLIGRRKWQSARVDRCLSSFSSRPL